MASIRKRGSKWQARVKRNGHTVEKSFLTKADAQRWARTTETEIERGEFDLKDKPACLTLHEALEKYGLEVTPQKRGAAVEHCRIRALQRHALARRALQAIRSADVASYRDERRLAGKGASTIAKEMNLISAVFKTAVSEWGIDGLANPVVSVRRPRQPNGRQRRLLPGEERLLLAAFGSSMDYEKGSAVRSNPWIRPIIVVAVESAMRRGEILGLRWEHVDLERRTVFLPTTKNGSPRQIPLTSRAASTLAVLPRSIDGRVFPVTPNALKLAFVRGLRRARLLYERVTAQPDPRMLLGLRFHDLRHEGVSRLAERLNVLELAAVSGHKDLATLRRYHHPRAEDLAIKIG